MISVLIPFFNEEKNVPLLLERLQTIFKKIGKPYEIVFVDDGSLDDSAKTLSPLPPHVKLVRHRRQMGKGRALLSAFQQSEGDVLIFMDADLEDNPDELPRFIEKIEEGYDLVNGARQGRKHNGIIRMYSKLANNFIRNMLKSPFSDINCGYKAIRRKVLEEITLYGNNFRFLPLGAFYEGFKVTEIPVTHKQRMYGKSKFGTGKIFIGFLDTLTAYFLYRFAERPLHFFGISGGVIVSLGSAILLYLGIERIIFSQEIYRRPLLFLGMLLFIVGVQVISTGLIGELIVYLHKKKA
jgi:glycosyltransferase involved in cell wall biosynthesis